MTARRDVHKALLIGLDCAVPGRWRRYAEAGLLPVGQRLLADGCFVLECLPTMPTLTTTNWATIATGAWPGTHGVTDFNPYRPGDALGSSPQDFDGGLQGFDARDVRAEFVWEAAVRAGLDSIVVNWPGAWPPRKAPRDGRAGTVPDGGAHDVPPDGRTGASPGRLTLVGGAGIELNEWRIGLPGMSRLVALASEQRFSSGDEPGAHRVVLPPGGGRFELPLAFHDAYDEVRSEASLVCQVVDGGGRPALRCSLPGQSEPLAELAAGEWSERLELPLVVGGAADAGAPASSSADAGSIVAADGPTAAGGSAVTGLFRLKLLEFEPGAGLFRLYVTDICRQTWLEQSAGVIGDTTRFAGLPTPGVGWDSFGQGLIDLDTFVELTGMATAWLADVCATLVRERAWHLFCAHFHAIDSFYHLCSAKLDEASTPDPAERRRYEAAEIAVYRQLDDAVGHILDAVDGPALTVLVSDHGATPAGAPLPLRRILAGAGLLTAEDGGGRDLTVIDWRHTLAAPQGSCFIRVNLEGREREGIVRAADFERVRRRVIETLLAYRDPGTGECPFELVVPKEEAAPLGLFGDGVGDVVYAVRPQFCEEHGQMLPQCTRSPGDWGMRALCLFSGAGVRPGSTAQDPASLTDVAPTICEALGIAPPLQADGGSLWPVFAC